MKILITGITGMAGSHLAEYLIHKKKGDVHGTARWRSDRENIKSFEDQLCLHECELRDPHAVLRLIQEIRPDQIYHLASQSSVAASWNSPRETLINNMTAQLNIFEAMRQTGRPETPILIPGSSEEYGLVTEDELPVTENNLLRPLSPYAVSKVTQDTLAFQYYRSYGIHAIRTRAFNHMGPRQADVFVASNFARQIAEIECGKREPILRVGNLEARRDFTDIRDIVMAYAMALEHCKPGEVYNIGSGKAHRIKEVLNGLLKMSRIIIQVKEDPTRKRPSDVPKMVSDSSKFMKATGWSPRISFNKSLSDLLQYWRERTDGNAADGESGHESKALSRFI